MYRHSVYTVLIAGIVLLIRFGEWRGIDLSSDGWCWNQAVNILLCCCGSFIQYVIIWILSTIIFCWQFSQLLLLLVVDQISNGWNNVWRGFNHERVTTKGLGLCCQGVYTCVNSTNAVQRGVVVSLMLTEQVYYYNNAVFRNELCYRVCWICYTQTVLGKVNNAAGIY